MVVRGIKIGLMCVGRGYVGDGLEVATSLLAQRIKDPRLPRIQIGGRVYPVLRNTRYQHKIVKSGASQHSGWSDW